ncbi:cytochrome P450 2D17-like, partial [Varanus komodoensis]|uniref:cytochrome P450 2D17-like n=1 Tax=Varanus komodoensis TaxID=61221 RepID=UPI001CF77D6C
FCLGSEWSRYIRRTHNLFLVSSKDGKKIGQAILFQAEWTNYIILNGYKSIKETLGKKPENFVDRPTVPLISQMRLGKKCGGIVFARCCDGWKDQRKFLVSILKTLAGRNRMVKEKISEEAEYLCYELRSKEGSFFDPRILTVRAVSNVVCVLTFGDRFEYNDMKFMRLMNLIDQFTMGIVSILPQLLAAGKWLFYFPGPHRKVLQSYEELCVLIREIVNEHRKTRDPNFPRDIIDAYLEEIEKAEGNPDSSFTEDNLINMVFDLFVAATETTASVVLWGLLILGNYPDVQRRVHEEMDKVVGRAKCPMMEDQQNLPYTNAVIHEMQRFADTMPLMLTKQNSVDFPDLIVSVLGIQCEEKYI